MFSKRSAKRRQQSNKPTYQAFESRNLLATVLTGTGGSDVASVTYVDDTHVDVMINDQVHSNVDITEGLRINLGDQSEISTFNQTVVISPGGDTITIDPRITGDVGIYNAERIIVDQGDNVFNLRFNPSDIAAATLPGTTNFLVDGTTVGLLNGNIKLGGFSKIQTGDGNDTFNINQNWEYDLTVEAGGGNDVFRFLSTQGVANGVRHNADGTTEDLVDLDPRNPISTPTPVVVSTDFDLNGNTTENAESEVNRPVERLSITIGVGSTFRGQAGNDRFVFRGIVSDSIDGGEGFDEIDYTLSQAGDLSFSNFAISSFRSRFIAERVIGSLGSVNSVTGSVSGLQNWFINGSRSRLVDLNSGQSIVFENFTNFTGSQFGTNRFYVLRTAADIRITGASWVQFSSELDPLQGNLNLIQHDVAVVDSRPSFNDGDLRPLSIEVGEPATSVFLPPIEVVISDATGNGITANFGTERTFFRANGPVIDLAAATNSNIEFHGSLTGGDNVGVENDWQNINIQTHGGDDTIALGFREQEVNNLRAVEISGGDGNDRINIESQSLPAAIEALISRVELPTRYALQDSGISIIQNGTVISLGQTTLLGFSEIEEIRFRGLLNTRNTLTVTPSAQTKFIVDGSRWTSNGLEVNESPQSAVLEIRGPLVSEATVARSSTSGTGAVLFGDAARNVHFFNLDEIDLGFETFPV